MIRTGARWALARRACSSSSLSAQAKSLLIYSSELTDVYDNTQKNSTQRLGEQGRLKLIKKNQRLQSTLKSVRGEESNLSEALKYVYSGVGQVHRGEPIHVSDPDDRVELHGSESLYTRHEREEPEPVYPLALFQDGLEQRHYWAQTHAPTEDSPPGPSSGEAPRGRRWTRKRKESSRKDRRPEFEILEDNLEPDAAARLLSKDDLFRYGTFDPAVPATQVPCGGCGALFHCQDPKLPGFIPFELFEGKTESQLRQDVCQRCHVMKNYNLALKMNVSPDFYPKCLSHMWDRRAVVLLIVDLLDYPGSVWPNILDLLGPNKKIILVGNKVDLLPQDSDKYLKRIEDAMVKTFLEKCRQGEQIWDPKFFSSCLISARTKYNIENLVSKVFKAWNEKGTYVGSDVFLVGTTNVGKSSLFNLLLESDLCKVIAINNVEKAMTSPVPGTTLNLLKFPIMRPDPSRVYKRVQRLKDQSKIQLARDKQRLEALRKHKNRKLGVRSGLVGHTFWKPDKFMPLTGLGFDLEAKKIPKFNLPSRLNPNHPKFADGSWCYDTPGTVTEDQIINLLTQEEVAHLTPDLPLRPKSFLIRNCQTIFIGGVARLDLLEGPYKLHPLLITLYCSDSLPINMVRTSEADEFYSQALGTDFLKVPLGSERRLKDFPALEGKEFDVDGVDMMQCSCDIVLSSVGWISCVNDFGKFCKVKAWTPGGKGLFLRNYPFLPYGHNLRGKRIPGVPTYENDKVFIPN